MTRAGRTASARRASVLYRCVVRALGSHDLSRVMELRQAIARHCRILEGAPTSIARAS